MAEPKTKETDASVDDFLDSVADQQQREDAKKLRKIFEEQTGQPAKMWGTAIVGFGNVHYKGRSSEGDWMAIGFAPRKGNLTLYIMDSYEFTGHKEMLGKLGPYKTGKGCLYVKRLSDVDQSVLEKIISKSYKNVASGKFLTA